jgi:hypothetical protein
MSNGPQNPSDVVRHRELVDDPVVDPASREAEVAD